MVGLKVAQNTAKQRFGFVERDLETETGQLESGRISGNTAADDDGCFGTPLYLARARAERVIHHAVGAIAAVSTPSIGETGFGDKSAILFTRRRSLGRINHSRNSIRREHTRGNPVSLSFQLLRRHVDILCTGQTAQTEITKLADRNRQAVGEIFRHQDRLV